MKLQASSDKKQLDVGANLFIGSLDPNVDERLLYDTFSAFGVMSTTAKVRVHLAIPANSKLTSII
jgi:splicing factor 3B subunit 4